MPWPTDERSFEVATEHVAGDCVVVFRGELDLAAADELWRCIDRARSGGPTVTIDMTETTFMDSSGLNLLLRAHAACGRTPRAVRLLSPSDAVREVLALTGTDQVFAIDERR